MRIVASRTIGRPDEPIQVVAYSPDGSTIVGGGGFINRPGLIRGWDSATLGVRATFSPTDGAVGMLKILPDGRTLLSAAHVSDGVESWDLGTGERLGRLRILPDPYRKSVAGHPLKATHIGAVATSADGATVALGCWDCTLKVVTWATGEIVERARPHDGNVDFVAFSRGGSRLLTGTYQKLFEWDADGRKLVRTISCDPSEHWTHVAIDGGDRVVSIASKGRMLVRDVADGTFEEYQLRARKPPACLAYSPRDGLLAIGQDGGSAFFWDTRARTMPVRVKLANDTLKSLAFAPDRPAICAVGGSAPSLVEHEYRT